MCESAVPVMMGDTKHDGGEHESDWLTDYEDVRDDAYCAIGRHQYSLNWQNGKAYEYCPHCGYEPPSKTS